MRALLLLLVLLPVAAHADEDPGRRWYVLPNFAFDSDDGVILGARGELALDEPGFAPYRTAYVIHVIFTTRGFQHHRFRFDRIGLGPGGRLRLTLHLAWRQWLNDGYWGIGNTTPLERAYVGAVAADDPRRKRYRYRLTQPFAHLTLRLDLGRPWQAFASLNVKWSDIGTYRSSLLREQRPFGMDGGLAALLSAGLLWDTRAPEVTPAAGSFCELSGRVAPPLPYGTGFFGGPFLSLRGYRSVSRRLTLSGRLMAEWLFGDVPFYEMVHWGGAVPIAGFGGAETLRGVSFGRWRGPGKAIANGELRVDLFEHTLFGRPLRWLAVPYLDAGAVFGAGELETTSTELFPIHPAAGAGVRAIFDEAFVGRVDGGVGLDATESRSGNLRYVVSWGLYVVFDHAF